MSNQQQEREAYEHRMRIWAASIGARTPLFAAHTQAVSAFATAAINSSILLNSAAAGAVLALLAALWGNDLQALSLAIGPAVRSIGLFAAGAFLAACTAVLAYFAQCYLSVADLQNLTNTTTVEMHGAAAVRAEDAAKKSRNEKFGQWLRIAAIVTGIASVGCFAAGAILGIYALLVVRDAFAG